MTASHERPFRLHPDPHRASGSKARFDRFYWDDETMPVPPTLHLKCETCRRDLSGLDKRVCPDCGRPFHIPIPEELGLCCPICDYSLTGLTRRYCPECGNAFDLKRLLGVPERHRIHRRSPAGASTLGDFDRFYWDEEMPVPRHLKLTCPGCRRDLSGVRRRVCPDCGQRFIVPLPPHLGLSCPECGYNISGLTTPRCPECGFALDLRQLLVVRRRKLRDKGSFWNQQTEWSLGIVVWGLALTTGLLTDQDIACVAFLVVTMSVLLPIWMMVHARIWLHFGSWSAFYQVPWYDKTWSTGPYTLFENHGSRILLLTGLAFLALMLLLS